MCSQFANPFGIDRATRVFRAPSKFLLNLKQPVVLGDSLPTARRAGLKLPHTRCHAEISNSCVVGLAGPMRHDGGIAVFLGHFNAAQRFRYRANLIQLDQDGIAMPSRIPRSKIFGLVTKMSSPTS
jgi:hypothetical protein